MNDPISRAVFKKPKLCRALKNCSYKIANAVETVYNRIISSICSGGVFICWSFFMEKTVYTGRSKRP